MNDLQRFKAICRGQQADFVPIIGLPGASGLAFGGAWGQVYQRLIETGMPPSVKPWTTQTQWRPDAAKSWSDYWGTLTPLTVDFWPCEPPTGIKSKKTVEGDYEIVEYNTGAVTRQLINNDDAYSMPEFRTHHIRDRQSFNLYKKLSTPGPLWPEEKITHACKPYQNRDKPLFISLLSTWGALRDLTGPEKACTILYDEPALAHEIIDFQTSLRKKYLFPLVERLKPEIIQLTEDCCYKQGMLISPAHFDEFCTPAYEEIAQLARQCGADVIAVDTDGNITELLPLLEDLGVNATYPVEAKAGNDLLTLRKNHPEFIFFGGLEKETINQGNEHLIENEIISKVPPMLKKGRYFPNIDHSLQPMCTFHNLLKFMKLLHEVTNNPLGSFYNDCP
jgi:uroporphyrinogen-III decarboxylase